MKEQRNWLEWTVFLLGGGLVCSVLGYLIYLALTVQLVPPQIEVKLKDIVACPGGYQVKVFALNRGSQTAEGVEIEVSLKPSEGDEERSAFTIDFLPENTEEAGWVTFSLDPQARGSELQARVLGFKVP
jgi:uncharacterized protein (TIGR02588 family)